MKREIVGVGWLERLMGQAARAALDVQVLHRWNRPQ